MSHLRIPTGFRPPAQGCEATLGQRIKWIQQPQRGCGGVRLRAEGHNPFRVVENSCVQPRVVPTLSGQPWAEGRCPVGAFRWVVAYRRSRARGAREISRGRSPRFAAERKSVLKGRGNDCAFRRPSGTRMGLGRMTPATLWLANFQCRFATAARRRSRDGNARCTCGGGEGFGHKIFVWFSISFFVLIVI